MLALTVLVAIIILVFALTKFYLKGESLSKYDQDMPITFDRHEPTKEMQAVNAYLAEKFTMGESLAKKRQRFDAGGLERTFDCTFKEQVAVFDGVKVPGEWTIVEGCDPAKRLLYLHGGAFTVGSCISHRPIVYNIAKRTGCAVFTPNYRLMPENKRMASIIDSRAAYHWIIENGPDGPSAADKVAVAGDSAGGNLALYLSNWIKSQGLRAPDAVIGISPSTDSTATSPTIRRNFETDIMLKPLIGPLLKIPHALLLWGSWATTRIRPASPLVSPARDNLADLPPTLIHVSAAEMLYGDAVRYVNKARIQGSNVQFQSWAHVCHVWHIFDEMLPEAHHGLDEIGAFMRAHGFSNGVSPG